MRKIVPYSLIFTLDLVFVKIIRFCLPLFFSLRINLPPHICLNITHSFLNLTTLRKISWGMGQKIYILLYFYAKQHQGAISYLFSYFCNQLSYTWQLSEKKKVYVDDSNNKKIVKDKGKIWRRKEGWKCLIFY